MDTLPSERVNPDRHTGSHGSHGSQGERDGTGLLEKSEYLARLGADAGRIAELVRSGQLGAEVPGCPGWDLAELVLHLGGVHRWTTAAVRSAAAPDGRPAPDIDRADIERGGPEMLATWFTDGVDDLLDALDGTEPDAATWHPFDGDKVVAVWYRRQAHETSIHRVDAEQATGSFTSIAPEFASDGIDEYFALTLPRLVARSKLVLPSGSLHVHCTDVPGEWLIHVDDGHLVVRREHAKGDAAIRGAAQPILLHLWSRPVDDAAAIEVIGDAEVADAWLRVDGL